MEINKITIIIIVAVLLSFPILLSCDNTQYKQIGDTYYYLMEDWQGNAHLYYKEGSEHFFMLLRMKVLSVMYIGIRNSLLLNAANQIMKLLNFGM